MITKKRTIQGDALQIISEFIHQSMEFQPLHDDEKVRIMIPAWFARLLQDQMRSQYNSTAPEWEMFSEYKFMGKRIFIGYENSIVIFHEDYTWFDRDDMYAELPIAHLIVEA